MDSHGSESIDLKRKESRAALSAGSSDANFLIPLVSENRCASRPHGIVVNPALHNDLLTTMRYVLADSSSCPRTRALLLLSKRKTVSSRNRDAAYRAEFEMRREKIILFGYRVLYLHVT